MMTAIKINQIRTMPVLILLAVLMVQSKKVTAQFYRGVDASFGIRSFVIKSDISQLNQLAVLQEGGQVGLILGSDIVRTKIGIAGFFYSSNSVAYTVDLFESDVAVNFYPLGLLKEYKRVQPYLSGGIVYDKIKFFGHYLKEDKTPINYSTSKEPYLGSLNQLRTTFGAGVEVQLLNNGRDFIQIFTEAKYGMPLTVKASGDKFANTTASNQLSVSLGVRFGANR